MSSSRAVASLRSHSRVFRFLQAISTSLHLPPAHSSPLKRHRFYTWKCPRIKPTHLHSQTALSFFCPSIFRAIRAPTTALKKNILPLAEPPPVVPPNLRPHHAVKAGRHSCPLYCLCLQPSLKTAPTQELQSPTQEPCLRPLNSCIWMDAQRCGLPRLRTDHVFL